MYTRWLVWPAWMRPQLRSRSTKHGCARTVKQARRLGSCKFASRALAVPSFPVAGCVAAARVLCCAKATPIAPIGGRQRAGRRHRACRAAQPSATLNYPRAGEGQQNAIRRARSCARWRILRGRCCSRAGSRAAAAAARRAPAALPTGFACQDPAQPCSPPGLPVRASAYMSQATCRCHAYGF